MIETSEILATEFELIRQDLIKRHDALKMRSSGKWASSLEVVVDTEAFKATARIIGEKYTEQLVWGRRPGKFPPIKAIEQWIKDKGLKIYGKMKISSLAYIIARKIAHEGTKYFQQGGTDLIESVITPQRIQNIIDKISLIHVDNFVNGLYKTLKDSRI